MIINFCMFHASLIQSVCVCQYCTLPGIHPKPSFSALCRQSERQTFALLEKMSVQRVD